MRQPGAWPLVLALGFGACGHHPTPGAGTLAPEDSQLLGNAAAMLDDGNTVTEPAPPPQRR